MLSSLAVAVQTGLELTQGWNIHSGSRSLATWLAHNVLYFHGTGIVNPGQMRVADRSHFANQPADLQEGLLQAHRALVNSLKDAYKDLKGPPADVGYMLAVVFHVFVCDSLIPEWNEPFLFVLQSLLFYSFVAMLTGPCCSRSVLSRVSVLWPVWLALSLVQAFAHSLVSARLPLSLYRQVLSMSAEP